MSLPVRACLSAITMLALGGMPTADAAFIRRSKLKQRATVGYKVVVVTSGDTATDVDSVVLDDALGLDRTAIRVKGSADIQGFNEPTLTVHAIVDVTYADASDSASFELTPCQTTPCAWSTATLSDGLSVKSRITGLEGDVNSQLETVVIARTGGALDALSAGAPLQVDASFDSTSGLEAVALGVDDVRTRWKGTVDEDPGTDTLTYEVVAYDADGVVLDSLSQTDPLVADAAPDGIGKVTLEQRKNGSYRLTTLTSSADGAAEVMEAAVTAEDGTVLAAASASTPDSLERRFVADGLAFEDPATVVGGNYSVVLDPFAADGSILEGSAQVDVLVADDTTEVFIEDLDPTDGLEIGYLAWVYDADLDEWFVDVAVTGEAAGEVASVELQIDSLSGNAAVEPTLSAVLVDQWNEYNLTFDSDTDITETAPVMVDITVQDETGATVDSAGASTSTGVVYKSSGFGKGTRNTATSTASKPELL